MTMFAIVNTVQRSTEFSPSTPYVYASIVFTTPYGVPFSSLEKLLLPFEPAVWIMIIFITVSSIIIIFLITKMGKKFQHFFFGRNNHTSILNYLNILLGGSVMHAPNGNFARTLFLIWMVGSFVLRSSYQGSLFRFIQSQKSAIAVYTVNKLIEFNFEVYTDLEVYPLIVNAMPMLSKRSH